MNKTTNNAIEVKYDGIKNITYEFLEKGVINADIRNPNLSVSDTIIDITPMRYYEGKMLNDSAKIGFRITVTGLYEIGGTHEEELMSKFAFHSAKIVFVADEERIEVDFGEKGSQNKKEYVFSEIEIAGLKNKSVFAKQRGRKWDDAWKDIVLQPDDIKRLAEAKNIGVYIDAYNLLDANGGAINFRDGGGSFQIEGIQGAMKRAYHYFVDETCYEDYISSFIENKQKALKKEKQRIEAERKEQEQLILQQEQAEQEEIARWRKKRNITLFFLVVSIVMVIIGVSGSMTGVKAWLGIIGMLGVFLGVGLLMNLYGIEVNDNNES